MVEGYYILHKYSHRLLYVDIIPRHTRGTVYSEINKTKNYKNIRKEFPIKILKDVNYERQIL